MKAVIMAGGEGTRLQPLSLGVPKPMVSLLDKPALGYILELLYESGVREACLTLRYMPGVIEEYIRDGEFGIELTTRVEGIALGTAGSVRSCADFIGGEDFLVVSGDCICDFDLRELMDYHKTRGAAATLALHSHPEPLEYGLVLTRPDGRIESFIEKPPWEGVATNRINTGIYVLSPAVLESIPADRAYDFGKELFPKLLADGAALYGLNMNGYWCDIGSPEAYLRCCTDMLEGKVSAKIGAEERCPGIYSAASLPHGVTLTPPVYIGTGAEIRAGASIGPGAVLGAGTVAASGVSVTDSAVLGASLLDGARVSGSIVCTGAVVGRGADLRSGSVIGEGCIIGDNAVIAGSARLWPERRIPSGAFLRAGDIPDGLPDALLSFTSPGVVSGVLGAELTVEAALKLGEASAAQKRVGLGFSGGDRARVIAEAFGCGVCAAGGELLRFDCGLPSCLAFAGRSHALPITACVVQNGDRASVMFFGEGGGLLPRDMERKLIIKPGGAARVRTASAGSAENVCGILAAYSAAAARYAGLNGSAAAARIRVDGGGAENRALRRALELVGCAEPDGERGTARLTARRGGTELCAVDERGRSHTPERMLVLAAALELSQGRRELAVPASSPGVLDMLARAHGARIYRVGRDGACADALYSEIPSLRDAIFMGALICGRMIREGISLAELIDSKTPDFAYAAKKIPLSRGRAEVMEALTSLMCEAGAEFDAGSGVRLKTGGGEVQIAPLRGENAVRIRGEGMSMEAAEELCAEITRRVEEIDGA